MSNTERRFQNFMRREKSFEQRQLKKQLKSKLEEAKGKGWSEEEPNYRDPKITEMDGILYRAKLEVFARGESLDMSVYKIAEDPPEAPDFMNDKIEKWMFSEGWVIVE